MPLGVGSGAGVIFGATGGVMEAALRTAYFVLEGHNPDPDAFAMVRGMDGIKETELTIAGIRVRAAVAHGLGNARRLIEKIKAGEAEYDFVEIMACPGGMRGRRRPADPGWRGISGCAGKEPVCAGQKEYAAVLP